MMTALVPPLFIHSPSRIVQIPILVALPYLQGDHLKAQPTTVYWCVLSASNTLIMLCVVFLQTSLAGKMNENAKVLFDGNANSAVARKMSRGAKRLLFQAGANAVMCSIGKFTNISIFAHRSH